MKAQDIASRVLRTSLLLLMALMFASNIAKGQFTVTIQTTGGQTQTCQGSTFVLTVDTQNGVGDPSSYTYNWTGDVSVLSIIPPGNIAVLNTSSSAGPYSFNCEVTDQGSNVASDNITIDLLQSPTASISTLDPTTFCEGGSALLEAYSEANYAFQWTKDGADISGETNYQYSATQSGSYRARVTLTTTGCSRLSNSISITANPLPNVTASNDGPACYNGTLNLTSTPNGMVSYNWTSTSTTPFSSTDQNPSITNVTPDNSGDYTVTVTDGNGCVNSAQTTVLVYDQLDGGTIGSNQTICYNGDPAAFTDIASPTGGDGAWTYQWQEKVGAGSWTDITGATGLTYDVPAGLTQTTQYRRAATNGCGTVYSNTITVTVYAALDGGSISSDQSICYSGNPAAFNNDVSASGGDGTFTYQWQEKVGAGSWTNIAGETGLTYDVPAGLTQTTMYRREATNLCGVVYSNELTVTVFDAVDGGTIGSDQSVCYNGDPDPFTDDVSPSGGNGAWTYQWEEKVGSGAWNVIAGANSPTYNVPAGITQTTQYRRQATNACGSAYSNVITVTVYPQMDGGTIAGDQSLCYDSNPDPITSTVDPSGGNGPWTYSWEYLSNCAGPWITIPGETGLTYDPPANQTETRCYRRVATNSCGTVYSNTVTITIYSDIDGGTIAADQTVCPGDDPAILTSTTDPSGGNGPFTYFWEEDTGTGWTTIAGETGLTYDPPAGITQTTSYRRGATNSCGTKYSNVVTVTVSNAVDGGQISTPSPVCYNGDPDPFTDVVSPSGGSGAWTYDWEYNEGGPWISLGVNSLTYDIPAGQTTTRTYRRVATNSCGTAYSNEVTVTVYPDLTPGTIDGNQTLCFNGDPAPINSTTLPNGGDGTWAYSWEYQSDCAGAWTTIAGETGETYDPPAGQTETRCYRRVETNTCGTVYSNTTTITIIPEITGNTIASDQTICYNSAPAQLTGPVPGGGSGSFTYRWQISTTGPTGPFSNIAGATSQNYSPPALTADTWYRRVVTSSSCVDISNVVAITVLPAIDNNTISADQSICYNDTPAQLDGSTPTGGDGSYTYQWQSSTAGAGGPFTDIAGATDINYQPGALTQTTWFRRLVNSGPCTDSPSNVVQITVGANLVIDGFTTTDPTCNGYTDGQATVNVSGGTPGYTYSWDTSPVQTGQTATGLAAGTPYNVTVTDAAGCQTIGSITLSEPAAIGLASKTITDVTTCATNTNGSIEVLGNGGTPDYTYTLYQGSTNLGTQTPAHPATAIFNSLGQGTYTVEITDVNGCPAYTEDIVVSGPDSIKITDVATTPISCAGSTDGTITITATGGTPPLEYSIDNGANFQASNVFTVGEGYYDIVVRDVNGCTETWPTTVQLVEPSAISFTYEITQVTTCNGDNSGKITISNVAGGSGSGYEYSIYDPAVWETSPVFENLPGGPTNPYTIRVKDSHGCISVANNGNPIYINEPTPITFSVQTTDVTGCWYNTNGTIKVTGVSGGTGLKQVSIDGIDFYPTTYTFNVGVGSYTVYVRDANGCIVTQPANISGPPAIVIDNLTTNDVTCFGGSDGDVTATASGGTGALEYSIDGTNFFGSGTFNSLTAGNYTMYVRDANGCILTQDFTINQPPALYFSTLDKTDITCNGANDGTITLAADGGTPPYSYSITGGAPFGNTTGSFTSLTPGSYTPAVQDNNGCVTIVSAPVDIIEPALLTINTESSTNITCFGANDGTITVEAIGGNAPLTYRLLDAGSNEVASNNTGSFTGLSAGTYTVEINDANSCGPITGGPYTINEPLQLTYTYTTVDLVCNGDASGQISITASGGTPPYEYSYDGGSNYEPSNIKNGLNGGVYTVIVRDANGCTYSQDITINEPAPINLSVSTTNIQCNGQANGEIAATATGGVDPLQYRIDGGAWQANGNFTGLTAKTYLVEVMDANGCMASANADVTEPSAINIDNTTSVDPTCSSPGSITVVASGGTGTLTYTLTPGGISNTTGVFNGLGSGTYTVDVTDDNGCGPVSSAPITLTSPSTISIDNVIITDVSPCYGDSNGSLQIVASGGTPPLQYSIDGGASYSPNNAFTGLAAGDYIISVNDANNCPQTQLVAVSEPAELVITDVTVIQPDEIHVTASGGTGALTYDLLENNSVIQTNGTGDFTGLPTGTYRVRVTDANGCNVETNDIILGANITVTSTDVTCSGDSDGTITIDITGGVSPFTVTCTNLGGTPFTVNDLGETTPGTFSFNVTGLPGDTYIITITDANSYTYPTYQVNIIEPAPLVATLLNVQDPLCNNSSDGVATFKVDGGTPVIITGTDSLYNISWTDGTTNFGPVTDTVASNVLPGTYTFRIEDSHGCYVEISDVTFNNPAPVVLDSVKTVDVTCHGDTIGEISIYASGGSGALTYTITGPENHSNNSGLFTGLPAGTYTISVTDENGCTASITNPDITINEPSQIMISRTSPDDTLACPNTPDGVLTIDVTGGTPDYTYLWSNGETTKDISNLFVGKYWVEVTDSYGCTKVDTFKINGPDMLRVDANIELAYCREINGTDKGSITLTNSTGGSGDFTDLTFEWINRTETGTSITNLTAGNYTLRITDTANCQYDTTFVVGREPFYDFRAVAGNDTTVCFNNPVTLVGTVSGGDPSLTFDYYWFENTDQLSNNNTLSVTLTESKTYLLKVYNQGSPTCVEVDTINLNVLPEIGLQVPLYVSAVQDTIISILLGKEYNIDVITKSVEYPTTFEWKPAEMFLPSTSWNSRILVNDDIKSKIPQNRIVQIQDPVTKRTNEYILVDVIATTEQGCTDSIRLYTKIINDVTIGNVFSPNGDGINDIWRVPKSYLFPDLSIEIFDRWGSLVWSARGDDAAKGWNGKSNSGKKMPIGTYYYVIKYNIDAQGANWKPITGSVTIVR
jgi:gliding motility-associated-like protein